MDSSPWCKPKQIEIDSIKKFSSMASAVYFLLSMGGSQLSCYSIQLQIEWKYASHMFNRKFYIVSPNSIYGYKIVRLAVGMHTLFLSVLCCVCCLFDLSIESNWYITHTLSHTSYTSNQNDIWTQHIFPPI